MAQRMPRRCSQCPRLATTHGRCEEHQRKPWANPSTNTQLLSGRDRERLRAQLLREPSPACARCGESTPARLQLDHIIELADGGAPLDRANLQLLCGPCHEAKTREARAARRRRPKVHTMPGWGGRETGSASDWTNAPADMLEPLDEPRETPSQTGGGRSGKNEKARAGAPPSHR